MKRVVIRNRLVLYALLLVPALSMCAPAVKESNEKQVLRIGTSADVSKSAKNIGLQIKETLTKAFDEANKKGGVRGVTFEYVFLDDEYDPTIARKNFFKFVNELKTDIILSPFGTVTTRESFDLANQDKLMVFFPAVTEGTIFRKADSKNFISLTASYYDQEKALVNYIFKKKRPQKIAFLYQNDAFGKDGLNGAKDALSILDFKNFIELPYDRNRTDFSNQVKMIKEKQPSAIGILSVPLLAKQFLQGFDAKFLSKKLLFGISDLRDEDLQKYIKERGLSFIYAESLPNWRNSSMQLAKDYLKFAETNGISPDPFSFEVYVSVQIFFYLIEHTKGKVTKEKLMQAAEQIKNLDFRGLKLNFDPEKRTLLDSVWIVENNEKSGVELSVKK